MSVTATQVPQQSAQQPAAAAAASAQAPTQAAPAKGSESLLGASQAQPKEAQQGEGSLLGTAKAESEAKAQAPEGEKAEGKPAEQKADQTKEQKQQDVVPEKYTDFKLPEGMQADSTMLQEFTGVAKELGLTQEKAQKLVDLQAKYAKNAQDVNLAQYQATVDGWKNESIKALGANHQQELGFAARFLDRFGAPELRQLLTDTGIGNHPLLVSAFVKAGKAISEDSFVDGKTAGSSGGKSAAEIIYPKQTK